MIIYVNNYDVGIEALPTHNHATTTTTVSTSRATTKRRMPLVGEDTRSSEPHTLLFTAQPHGLVCRAL